MKTKKEIKTQIDSTQKSDKERIKLKLKGMSPVEYRTHSQKVA